MEEFQLYEVVNIRSSKQSLKDLQGKEGHILGIYDEDDGAVSYRVVFYPPKEDWDRLMDEEWSRDIGHEDLISTGRVGKKEDHYPGDKIRVRPDGSVVDSGDA